MIFERELISSLRLFEPEFVPTKPGVCRVAIIDEEMERLGLSFRRRSTARRLVLPAAFNAGQEAGERFECRLGALSS